MSFWTKMLAAAAVCSAFGCAAQSVELPFTGVILDVRTAEEFDAGHIIGAKLLPYDQIDEKSASRLIADKKTPIVVHCRSGRRSKVAVETLKKLGYTEIIDLGTLGNAAKVLQLQIVTK